MFKLVSETATHYDIEEYDNEDITVATIKRHLVSKKELKELLNAINRPLKFEELESGMRVWNNSIGRWVEIMSKGYELIIYCVLDTEAEYYGKYRDDIFYKNEPFKFME